MIGDHDLWAIQGKRENNNRAELERRIELLEAELTATKLELKDFQSSSETCEAEKEIHDNKQAACLTNGVGGVRPLLSERTSSATADIDKTIPFPPTLPTSHHAHLLLADSALPLGSFAFSAGLESYLAHRKAAATASSTGANPPPAASSSGDPRSQTLAFLPLSLAALSSATLPYFLAAHAFPSRLPLLLDQLDASTPCPCARRASVAQGRALVVCWERALCLSPSPSSSPSPTSASASAAAAAAAALLSTRARAALADLSQTLKTHNTTTTTITTSSDADLALQPHLAPVLAAACAALGLGRREAAYLYLFAHARGVVSAAVRAGALGPYAALAVLASAKLRGEVARCLERGVPGEAKNGEGGGSEEFWAWAGEGEEGGGGGGGDDSKAEREEWRKWSYWERCVAETAGQTAPVLDLWQGRHEIVYSRIFNS